MKKGATQNRFEIVAKTTFGLEGILSGELAGIGAADIKMLNRAVSYKGDMEMLYRSNYCLRTALRILKPILSIQVSNETELYQAIRIVNWDEWLDKRGTLAVDATVKSKYFTHSHYVAQKVKDAMVDQFRDKYGIRPSVDLEDPDLRVNIHIAEKTLTVSLDSSGESLYRRGYRVSPGKANLSEVLAAGMIMLTGWKGNMPFVDLMCGSGTLPIEAALIAHKIPPGFFRKKFGFQQWPGFRPELLRKIHSTCRPAYQSGIIAYGYDNATEAIKISRKNADGARLKESIRFTLCDFTAAERPGDQGLIIINPPYGERLKQDDLNVLYKRIGDTLKNKFQGFDAWIISSNPDAMKHVGLRPDKHITLFNGQLECKFNHYNLYEGSRKTRKQQFNINN